MDVHGTVTGRTAGMIGVLALLTACAASGPPKPSRWFRQSPAPAGYAIQVQSVSPAPGTPLKPGSTVHFKVQVGYTLSAAPRAHIDLVFQDESNTHIGPKGDRAEVAAPSGSVTLEQDLEIPAASAAKTLILFVPLMPEGIKRTEGEPTLYSPLAGAR